MYLFSELSLVPLLVLLALWTLGGWLIAAGAFHLPPRERGLVGLGLGLALGTWLANLLGHFLPATLAFWGAALLLVALGLAFAWPLKREDFPRESFQPAQWFLFFVFVVIFTLIGRGFGFFDDHQNLPMVSALATGDLPLHFPYNPELRFGYHYFLLLVAAQFTRLAAAGPWTALDLARGLTLALTLTYGGFLTFRLTKSRVAETLAWVFMAFAGGARWLFLLLPLQLQRQLSSSVQLIGSGADTGPNLITAIYKYWKIEGLGPLPFPFMFGSGLDPSFSLFHNGWGTSAITLALLLVLLAGLRRSWRASLPIVILLASLALANEVTFATLYLGLALATLAWMIQKRTWRLPRSLWLWVGLMFVGGLLALVQGGMLTEIARGWLERQAGSGGSTYFKVGFALGLPTILSSHLGYLSLLNPLQWVAILGETGLAVFAVPLVLKQFPGLSREENWFEAAWVGSIIVSLLMVFVQYTGNAGPTAASRMQAHFLTVVKIYAVPLVWLWIETAKQTFQRERRTSLSLAWGLATIFSGLSLFGLQLAAAPNPVYAIYLTQLDAQMFTRHWDQLTPHALVYDATYPRAATIFGRPIRSSKTMGETLPEWNTLGEYPDPFALKAAGYDYLYVDLKYLTKYSDVILKPCVKELDHLEEKNGSKVIDARSLFDVSACH